MLKSKLCSSARAVSRHSNRVQGERNLNVTRTERSSVLEVSPCYLFTAAVVRLPPGRFIPVGAASQPFENHPLSLSGALTISKIVPRTVTWAKAKRGHAMIAVFENVRRYRNIASLFRQAAAFRPTQKCTLLEQANEWERLAMTELEAHFANRDGGSGWELAAAA